MFIAALALVHAVTLSETSLSDVAQVSAAVEASQQLSEDDLLLYSLELDSLTLTETLTAYGEPDDPLVALGELARLLDLDLSVSPAGRRVTGSVGEARRSININFDSGLARIGGKQIALNQSDYGFTPADIYLRASKISAVLPARVEVNAEGLSLRLKPSEKLPIQARIERLAKIRSLGQAQTFNQEPAVRIASPYRPYSLPSFDVSLEGGRDTRTLRPYSHRYDVRMAGDLLYTNFQGYVGSDERGRANSARMLFERRSVEGALPLNARRISAGDVFTPALSIGPRSISGRGISLSTAPLEQSSVFDRIDLRGELPIGYDVELYINDVLRSGQRTPVEGRYEFLDVPLSRGMNVIRIVSYGPRGDRSEQVKVINVGGGALRKGETQFEFGLVQQDRSLVEPQRDALFQRSEGIRLVASASYGLSEGVTLVGGASRYGAGDGTRKTVAVAGLRTSVSSFAVQLDAAADVKGGKGLTLGLAGQPLGVSTMLQHSEYRGGFIDEHVQTFEISRISRRHTSLAMDFSVPFVGHREIPLSFRVTRDTYGNGGVSWVAAARASTTVASTLVSTGFDYRRDEAPGYAQERLTGNLSASRFLSFAWQLRASADYEVLPSAKLRATSFTADRNVSEKLALRFGLGRTLGAGRDTYGQAGTVFRSAIGDLAVTGDYSFRKRDWRLAVRLGFGSLFDPSRRRYVMTPPGPTAGGNAVLQAFVDRDDDGKYSPGDGPVPGVVLEGARRRVTGASGHAVITGLGFAPVASVRANAEALDEVYAGRSGGNFDFAPRPGTVVQIPYPLVKVGEVYARFVTERAERTTGLSALKVRLVTPGRPPIEASTEFDGSVVFANVPVGDYHIELDPEQASRLGLSLSGPMPVRVNGDSGAEIEGRVRFEERTAMEQDPNVPAILKEESDAL